MSIDLNHEWGLLRISQETISWRCQRCGNRAETRIGTPSLAGCPGEHPPRDAIHGAMRAMLKELLAIDWSTVTEDDARAAWNAACEDVGRPDLKLGAPVPLGFTAGLQIGKLLRKERE